MTTHFPNNARLGRRTVLGGAALAGVAASLGLSACGKDEPTPEEEAQGNKNVLPAYKKLTPKVSPDQPGDEFVQDFYSAYPNPTFKAVNHETGKGGDLTAMILTYGPPPTPLGKNPYWQEMNKRLNVNFKPDIVPATDYIQKFSTVIGGGGELPNLIQVPTFMALPRVQQLIDSRFLDLSEQLGGDAIASYPNLANLPSYAWQNAIAKGRIWGVPVVRAVFPNLFRYRKDISATKGFQEVPKTEEGFIEWAKAVSDPGKQQYALGNSFGLAWMLTETLEAMYQAPNNYYLEGGQLRQNIDHDGWWQAMELLKKLWGAKVIHPDTPTMTQPQVMANLFNGKVVACEDGQASLSEISKYPNVTLATRPTWTKDGSKTHVRKGSGIFSVLAIEKGQKDRTQELLNILDYLAAPFGSEEYTLTTFGLANTHHKLENGSPVPNQDKAADLGVNYKYVVAPPGVMYAADKQQQDLWKDVQATQRELAKGLVEDPCAGLKSDAQEKAGKYSQAIADARNEYVLGRKPLSDVRAATDAYTKEVWPEVKKELEEKRAARGQ